MKRIIMILLVVFGLGVGSRAQAQMLNLNYQMSLPLGDQHDFISKMSFRGFSMDYHYFLSERLAVGASLGWNTLYKHLDYATGHFTMNGEKVTISGTAFATPTFSYNSWGNYWGWYPGWDWFGWGGVWGGWYPWYPWYSGGYYYAYDKGTVVIDMLDAKKADKETKRVPVLWTGMVDGILAGNQNYLAERLEKNINQCFIQSPYLKTTK